MTERGLLFQNRLKKHEKIETKNTFSNILWLLNFQVTMMMFSREVLKRARAQVDAQDALKQALV